MIMRIFIIMLALTMSACSKIKVESADVSNPPTKDKKQPELKILNKAAREAIGAKNPDDLVAVFTDDGVILYGAPGKSFKYIPKEQTTQKKGSKGETEPVNDVTIKTFVNSPACQSYKDLYGNLVWYPSDCPK